MLKQCVSAPNHSTSPNNFRVWLRRIIFLHIFRSQRRQRFGEEEKKQGFLKAAFHRKSKHLLLIGINERIENYAISPILPYGIR